MSIEIELEQSSLTLIARRCEEESKRFFQKQSSDPRYCYELFRRALAERNQQAWDLIYKQYHALLSHWVICHPSFSLCDEEVQYFINRAFERFWTAIISSNFARFSDLKSLLRYLQMCVASTIMDHLRWKEQVNIMGSVTLSPVHAGKNPGDVETLILDRVQQIEMWRLVDRRLNTEKERKIIYGSFVLDQKPRQIYDEFSDLFENVAEVSSIKEIVMDRLRRDQALLSVLHDA